MGEYKLYDERVRTQSLCVKVFEGIFIIPYDEIAYLQSQSNYTTIYKTDGTQLVASKTLGTYQSKLDERFLRIHSSTIVNFTQIKWISTNLMCLRIKSGKLLSVAKSRKNVIKFLCE